ncbi:hypothetical protein [Ahrensia marina]|uniref:Uncharacterized protein n=1 Tax=Ahrensia marina TaxID=1514904 RepID=A0A0N0E6I4_9HYPH|nr:hypothetical protein [Ahrensia marina]KPB00055.1 hypothetical protein SU32_15905 [Ahrensia marina]
MAVRSSNTLLCALVLLMGMIFTVHSAIRASVSLVVNHVEFGGSSQADKVFDNQSQMDFDGAENDHCAIHAVFIKPEDTNQKLLINSHLEIATNLKFPFFEKRYNLLRPPKV